MSSAALAIAWMAATIAVGRVLLSLLPVGAPGHHAWVDLPITLAASYLLGSIALETERQLLAAIGANAELGILAVPWVVIAIGRWMTLPGTFLPRHERPSRAASASATVLGWIAVLLVGIVAWTNRERVFSHSEGDTERNLLAGAFAIADVLALLALCNHGLERARRPSLERGVSIAVLAIALTIGSFGAADHGSTGTALCFGAGAASAIPWLRRGDRRAALLAVIAFGGAPLFSSVGALLGAVGLAWLYACTARPSRTLIGVAGAGALAITLALRFVSEQRGASSAIGTPTAGGWRTGDTPFFVLAGLFALTGMLASWRHWRRRRARRAAAHADSEGSVGANARADGERSGIVFEADAEFLFELGAAALIATLVYSRWNDRLATMGATAIFAPLLLLAIGTSLLRTDSTAENA